MKCYSNRSFLKQNREDIVKELNENFKILSLTELLECTPENADT